MGPFQALFPARSPRRFRVLLMLHGPSNTRAIGSAILLALTTSLCSHLLADTIYLLLWAFNDDADPPCMDAADVDGDNEVSALVDALALLEWVFQSGDAPPEPGTTSCGADDDDDIDVECETVADLCA